MTKPLPTPETVAYEFARVLKIWLTNREWHEMLKRNSRVDRTKGSVCHSHDFCDANMAMDAALRNLGVKIFHKGQMIAAVNDLWNRSWDLAFHKHLGGSQWGEEY